MKNWRAHALGPYLLLLAALVYAPGLTGPFLFDDFSNLALLPQAGRLDRVDNVIHYLLSGFAGPTGRPIAMASFIPEASHWPADPLVFKRTNLALHLLNMVLLAAVARRLFLLWNLTEEESRVGAWYAAALWGLHPLWVSTTLYVVQRMTLLATFFVLLGMLLYLEGRGHILRGRTRRGLAYIAMACYGMGLLATLSKENGALLPLLLLVVERYGLAAAPPLPAPPRRWIWGMLGLPALAVLAYLASFLPALVQGDMGPRNFTPLERLLTEGRVLWGYLAHLFVPRSESGGLYAEEVALSRGLFSPPTTLLAWLGLTAAWTLAEGTRRRHGALALAITFFLAGHLLESTWIPLELAFEHRNYLPALLLFLPLALVLARLNGPRRKVAISAVLALLAGLTLIRADLWGRPFAQALTWARQNPDSPRAQAHLASLWLETNNLDEAGRLLDAALRRHPDDFLLAANRMLVACRAQHLQPPALESVLGALRASGLRDPVRRFQLTRLLSHLRDNQCGPSSHALFGILWEAAQRASNGDSAFQAVLLQERALLRLTKNNRDGALADFLGALRLDPSPDAQLAGAAALASHGAFSQALTLLDEPLPRRSSRGSLIERMRDAWLDRAGYWERERRHLRAAIAADLDNGALPAQGESANLGRP